MSYGNVDKSDGSIRFFERKLFLVLIIALVAGIIFTASFVLVFDTQSEEVAKNNLLPPDCYSINGKQVCPKR
jgi:uncharacterized BrkB/YihY/UPF0761 family membrane protein